MVQLTLRQCAYFLAVADQGGIAQAARALNISQPAVAQALDKLEALYGFKLFLRHHARGTELTLQGRAFYGTAQALLRQAARSEEAARAIAAAQAGTIRFACFHTLAPFYLARIAMAHRSRRPGVELQSSELLQDEILSGIDDGSLDLALTYDMGLEGRDLVRSTLADLSPLVLLSAAHPLAKRESLSLTELAEEPFVLFDGPVSGDYFAVFLAEQGIAPPVVHAAGSMESVRCAVASGLGFSLSVMRPKPLLSYDGGELVYIPIAETSGRPATTLKVVLIRKSSPLSSGLLEDFAEICRLQFDTAGA